MQNKIFFVHIPRTAGTTIESMMREHLTGVFFKGYTDRAIVLRSEREVAKADYFIGHNFYYARDLIPAPTYAFTFLRDPVERAYSLWTYMLENNPDKAEEYGGFMSAAMLYPHFSNHQVRYLSSNYDCKNTKTDLLSNSISREKVIDEIKSLRSRMVTNSDLTKAKSIIDELNFFGLFEHLQHGALKLFEHWDITINQPMPHERKTKKNKNDVIEISENDIQQIKELNELDIQLYEYALNLYQKKYPEIITL